MKLGDLEGWQSHVAESIEHFISTLPPEMQAQLDYTPESLGAVETWLLERYPTPAATVEETDIKLLNGVECYIGETYRKNLGGYWNVHFKEFEPDFYYGELPVIEGFLKDTPVCPYLRHA